MHYVAPPKIKSTDDFGSRIEARSARNANAPIGQVNIETAKHFSGYDNYNTLLGFFTICIGIRCWHGDILGKSASKG